MKFPLQVKVKDIGVLARNQINYYPESLGIFFETFSRGLDEDVVNIEFTSVIELDKAKDILNIQ
jgi:hypothetical protein